MHLARFPRVRLAHLPTPLEPMERLSKELGAELWIKRDDCTGMSTGGNKTRKLEFLMAEAQEAERRHRDDPGCDRSRTMCRQTVAYRCEAGPIQCHVLLEDRTGSNDAELSTTTAMCLLDLPARSNLRAISRWRASI